MFLSEWREFSSARIPVMFLNSFPSWSGYELISTPVVTIIAIKTGNRKNAEFSNKTPERRTKADGYRESLFHSYLVTSI